MDNIFDSESHQDTEQKPNVRPYRSVPTFDMVMDNTLTNITKWKYIWKSSNGVSCTCDFTQLKACASDEHLRFLISKFEQSGWSEASKSGAFLEVRSVLRHAHSTQTNTPPQQIEFSVETCTQYVNAIYQSMVSTGKGLYGKPINASTIGHIAKVLSGVCKKFGLGEIPRSQRSLSLRSAQLDCNNYTRKELKAIVFSLLVDRKAQLKRYEDETLHPRHREIAFNRLMYSSVFLTIYYLGTGQTETLSMSLEEEWHTKKSGSGRITLEGLKTRGYTVESRTFTPRASCKEFFDSHFSLSQAHSVKLGLDKHYLFRRADGGLINGGHLSRYVQRHLVKQSKRLQSLIEINPDFRLTCNLLKSSIKQLAEQTMGRQAAATHTRNANNTYDAANYGKVSKGEARNQLAIGLSTLQALGDNPGGGTAVAIATTKETLGLVISHDEWETLRQNQTDKQHVVKIKNGGFCKGSDTQEKKAFKKNLERSGLLTQQELAQSGCGFVIKCFSCFNFGVVDDPHDIWRLLSFEQSLNGAMANHQNLRHFLMNFGEVKAHLNTLKERFKKAHLQAAIKRLERESHPLWDEDAIVDLFRG